MSHDREALKTHYDDDDRGRAGTTPNFAALFLSGRVTAERTLASQVLNNVFCPSVVRSCSLVAFYFSTICCFGHSKSMHANDVHGCDPLSLLRAVDQWALSTPRSDWLTPPADRSLPHAAGRRRPVWRRRRTASPACYRPPTWLMPPTDRAPVWRCRLVVSPVRFRPPTCLLCLLIAPLSGAAGCFRLYARFYPPTCPMRLLTAPLEPPADLVPF